MNQENTKSLEEYLAATLDCASRAIDLAGVKNTLVKWCQGAMERRV